MPRGSAARLLLFPLILAAVGLAIYWPAVHGPFVLDDYDLTESISAIRRSEWRLLMSTGRPLLTATFRWNFLSTGGFNPTTQFHLTNILLHVVNALLLWRFMLALCGAESLRERLSESARAMLFYGVPLLFLALPIQTEAVAYISSRSDVLSTTFYLAALWLFASPLRERQPWLAAAGLLVLAAAAALSKQDKVTLPAAILMLDYLVLSGFDWRKTLRSWPTYAAFAVAGTAGFFVVIKPFLFAGSAGFGLDWTRYLFTQFRMYFLYLKLTALPFGLNLDHDIAPSDSLLDHGSLVAFVILAAAVGAALYYRRRFPLIAFGVLFFFLTMAPSSSFYPLLDFAAERRMYLPLVGLLPAVFLLVDHFARPRPALILPVLAALTAVYGVATHQRAQLWGDDLALWGDSAQKSPEKWRPWMWLGKVQFGRGLIPDAQRSWERAAEVGEGRSKELPFILMNLGLVHATQKNYPRAVGFYEKTLDLDPANAAAWAQLAVAQMRLGRDSDGWKSFEKAFEHGEGQPELFRLRGQEYYQAGKCAEAADDFERALKIRPEDTVAANNLRAARQCAGLPAE